jgi:dienelactone hydrolase
MKNLLLPALWGLCCWSQPLAAQSFTQKNYGFRVEKDLVYGQAVNYLGITDELTLDLYKPVGDGNTHRPLLVLVHGGAWLSGCKAEMSWLAEEMAQRGYVVASVNYRKGWHKDDYVPTPAGPPVYPAGNALYAADSTEMLRAIFRGMQDVKGAIRWLKARALGDSTCNQSVLVGGESAGAFISLAVGVLDRASEKPAVCYALPDAPVPGSNLANSYMYDCAVVSPALPAGALQRPDLGSIEGDLNQNGYDASVKGVISFYGGVPWDALTLDWLQGPNQPAFYLYHQTCDGVVPFGYGIPMYVLSAYCNVGATPWHYNYPHTFGNGAIAAYFESLPDPPAYTTSFIPCDAFNPGLALFECLRYADNGSYHFVHNRTQEAQKIAEYFSPMVATLQNSAPCLVSSDAPASPVVEIRLFPNPARTQVQVQWETPNIGTSTVILLDVTGRLVQQKTVSGQNCFLRLEGCAPGLYCVKWQNADEIRVVKLLVE